MAARLRAHHQEDVKRKIQASQLVNLLQDHALKGTELSEGRKDAAKFLLNKIISNPPQSLEHSGPDGGPIPAKVEVELVRPKGA